MGWINSHPSLWIVEVLHRDITVIMVFLLNKKRMLLR